MRLGELLVTEGLVSPEGVKEALETQVVHGGRLGTNLLELGLLAERDLARVLGKQRGVAFASGEMLPDPKAAALLDAAFCDDKDVLPMRVDVTRLHVAVINPLDLETLDAIGFKTGKRVVPVIIPEFRMHQLLRRLCKAFRPLRPIDMNALRPSRTRGTKEDGPRPGGEDLINDADFQAIYAQALGAHGDEEVLEGQLVDEPAAPPVAPQTQASAAVLAELARQMSGERAAADAASPTPLTFAQAQQALARSQDRNDVARTVLRFAVGKWRRCLLLAVQGELLTGWQGVGQGIRPQAVNRIGIVLRPQTTFRLVRDTRAHYVGPMRRDAGTGLFYKLLGGGFPATAVLLPLLVRGKVVHILYVDNGPDQLTPPDVGELLILAQSVARSYEAMVGRRVSG